jgi:uncharacterized OB-fold protein
MQELIEHYRRDADENRLAYQECQDCGKRIAFVRPFCCRCGSASLAWKAAAGEGRVVAHTVLHRAPTADYKPRLPYAVALVDLAEGLRVMGHAAPDLRVGDQVRLSFEKHGERNLAYFHAEKGTHK